MFGQKPIDLDARFLGELRIEPIEGMAAGCIGVSAPTVKFSGV